MINKPILENYFVQGTENYFDFLSYEYYKKNIRTMAIKYPSSFKY